MTDRMPRNLRAFVAAVVAAGFGLIGYSLFSVHQESPSAYASVLAIITIASGRFAIKVPGRAATVSVSEVFVFASVLLFGPAAATLIVALDGLWASLFQKNRRAYRSLFNVAEPAVSTWTAGHVFLAIYHAGGREAGTSGIVLAAIAMAAVFFALNSGLTAIALGLESGASPYDIWRRHARYLAANYYAAASLAALGVTYGGSLNVAIVALVVPLLIVSYLAYQEASTRVDDAQRHVKDVEHLYQAATEMLAIAVDAKDQVTHGHIRRVQRHTLAVARALGVTDPLELKAIEAGALLHDIGKLAVPDYVLNKPSALTRAEFETIKAHASMGARILTAVDFPFPVVPIVRHHHEQWNGRGYPDGLVGAEIPIGARIIAVVDCYDALTSDRPYRPRLEVQDAVAILRSRAGTFYDPAVVDTFIEMIPLLQQNDAQQDDATPMRTSVVAGLTRSGVDADPDRSFEELAAPIPARVRALIDTHAGRFDGVEACLFTLTPSGERLAVAHATSGLRHILESLHLPVGGGVSGWVAGNRSTIRHADATLDLGHSARTAGLRSCTSTPVFAAGDMFGVLTVYRSGDGPLANEIAAVGVLGQEVGLAIARVDESENTFTEAALSGSRATSRYATAAN